MIWASGSELAQAIWNDMKTALWHKADRDRLKESLIKRFEEFHSDIMYEVDWDE